MVYVAQGLRVARVVDSVRNVALRILWVDVRAPCPAVLQFNLLTYTTHSRCWALAPIDVPIALIPFPVITGAAAVLAFAAPTDALPMRSALDAVAVVLGLTPIPFPAGIA